MYRHGDLPAFSLLRISRIVTRFSINASRDGCVTRSADWVCRGRSSVRPPWRTYSRRTSSRRTEFAAGAVAILRRPRGGRRYEAAAEKVASAPRGGRIRGGRIRGRRRRNSTSPTGGRRYGAPAEEVASAPRGGRIRGGRIRGGRIRGRHRRHSTSPTGGRRYGAPLRTADSVTHPPRAVSLQPGGAKRRVNGR